MGQNGSSHKNTAKRLEPDGRHHHFSREPLLMAGGHAMKSFVPVLLALIPLLAMVGAYLAVP